MRSQKLSRGGARLGVLRKTCAFFIAVSIAAFLPTIDVASAATGDITTMVGTGTGGYGGDGGLATAAAIDLGDGPYGAATDSTGAMYFPDMGNNRVRRVSPSGTITTVAGTGEPGYSGDGGAAISAQLDGPEAVVVDDFGNLLIADRNNYRVRKVDPNGTISTVAGTGADPDGSAAGDGGPAIASPMEPQGLALDSSGRLYISDTSNNRVRRVDAAGIITTVAGDGDSTPFRGDGGPAVLATLNIPMAITIDAQDNLYIADMYNHRVRRVTPGGTITTVAGSGASGPYAGGYGGDGGAATSARLSSPNGLDVDAAGTLFIADTANHRVRRVDALTGTISTLAGTGAFNGPTGDGGPATAAVVGSPRAITVGAAGAVIVAANY